MKILYLGSDPARFAKQRSTSVIHLPLLEIVPRPADADEMVYVLEDLPDYTHYIFTSKHAPSLFLRAIERLDFSADTLRGKEIIAIGLSTAEALKKEGMAPTQVAKDEVQEGVIALLRLMEWNEDAYVLMPRSSLARSTLEFFFTFHAIRYQVCDLYDTRPRASVTLPSLDDIDEIVFTSPSTVRAFRRLCPIPPAGKQLTPLGPVTAEALRLYTQEI
jgi:uroporphyrinogen-III synthase